MKRERRSSAQTLSIFEALLAQPRAWRHGYDLSSETELKSGTLYPVLMRLDERGFLGIEEVHDEVGVLAP